MGCIDALDPDDPDITLDMLDVVHRGSRDHAPFDPPYDSIELVASAAGLEQPFNA